MTMQRIRDYYGVPAKRGMKVTVDGKPGVIVAADRSSMHLRVRMAEGIRSAHPTWRVDYDAADGSRVAAADFNRTGALENEVRNLQDEITDLRAEVARKDEELAAATAKTDERRTVIARAMFEASYPEILRGVEWDRLLDHEKRHWYRLAWAAIDATPSPAAPSSVCPTGEHPEPCGCLGSEGESK